MTNKYKGIKMKTSPTQRSEEGFAAVTVMVISLLGGLIVFDTVKENVNQERMAGNYSKELNARLQAENGLAAAYNELSANSSISDAEMMVALNTNTSTSYHYTLDAWENSADTSIMELDSKGAHYEGNYKIRGSMQPGASGGTSVYTGPITTCDGATVKGVTIDSYDSSNNTAYNSTTNSNSNGDVSVLNQDASLTILDYTPIKGDVSVNGDLTITGSGSITGDTYSAGNIHYGDAGDIAGNVQAMGNITTSKSGNGILSESLTSNGDIELRVPYDGDNINISDGNITTSESGILIGNANTYETNQVNSITPPECDILDLQSQFNNKGEGGMGALLSKDSVKIPFDYGNNNNVTLDTENPNSYLANPIITDIFGTETSVYILDISDLTWAQTLTIESDITIYLPTGATIEGNIDIKDGASLNIITESTLTLQGKVTGNITDSEGNETTASSLVNSNNDNYFNLYSGYNGDDVGLTLKSANSNDLYMTAYAPTTNIEMNGGGTLYGSLRGKTLDINNGAGIHYDEALADSNTGSTGSGEASIEIKRWF